MIPRIRANAGPWSLIAVLGLTVVCVLAATPRIVNRMSDTALRRAVAEAPPSGRDLTFVRPTSPDRRGELSFEPEQFLDGLGPVLPDVVRATAGAQWAAAGTGLFNLDGPGVTTQPDGLKPKTNLWHLTGLQREITLAEGRLPASRAAPPGATWPEIEVVVAAPVADRLGLRVGQTYTVQELPVRVVGRFTANDPGGAVWAPYATALQTGWVPGSEGRIRLTGTLFTDLVGVTALFPDARAWQMLTTARFRLDEGRLHAGLAGELRAAVLTLRSDPVLRSTEVAVDTRLDELLADFARGQAAVRALLAVVAAGIAGLGVGLLVLAARLAVDRRRLELRLLRARGASLARLGAILGAEAVTVGVPAMCVGWLAHYLVPGRPGGASLAGTVPLLSVAVAALLAVPVAGVASQRDRPPDQPGHARRGRADLVLARPGPRRLVAELALVVLAGLGVVLLHRRDPLAIGVDPYLSAVPVLVAVTAGLAGLRIYPAPVRLFGRLAGRRRAAPAFLGLARAGRHRGAVGLPLVVLVLAVALAGFAGAIRAGIDQARDVAAATEVGADFRLTAPRVPAGAVEAVAAAPGVRSVVAVSRMEGRALVMGGSAQPDQLVVAVVDPAGYERLLTSYRIDPGLPPQVHLDSGPVPVVASPALAARFTGDATLVVGGTSRPLRLVGTVDRLPGLDGGEQEFLLVPRAALGVDADVTVLLVSAPRANAAALAGAATGAGTEDLEVTALTERRRAVEKSAFNDAVTLAFTLGLLAGGLAGVLAVALLLVTEARTRGRVLSLLRTLGLSVRQARGVLLAELAPLMVTALVIGAAVGAVLPLLFRPTLGLTAFTGGVPLPVSLDATTAVVLAALFLALLGAAVLTEAAANRRLGLGRVLRVGETE